MSLHRLDAAPAQPQPASAPDDSSAGTTLARSTSAPATKSQALAASKKLSPAAAQHQKAIAMSSAELGALLRKPTERIAKYLGDALAHEVKAKEARAKAQREFEDNIAYYWEAKQRLRNSGYRTDVDGGKERTPSDNEKCFGAPNWAALVEQCCAYSLQHADRKLKAFAKGQGLLTDEGDNIDDEEQEEVAPERPEPRRAEDPTPQRRYEHIATAAMEIASRNPEGVVERQILAAAEHIPVPQTPLPPDVYTDVLSFITKISKLARDENVRAEAKNLIGKMLLHKPTPDPAKVLAEATEEEKRKRDRRIAKKNRQALGSEGYNPPAGTGEHVQRSDPAAQASAAASAATKRAKSSASEQPPLMPGKKYTVRPAASGGHGIFEVGSAICVQRHATMDSAWEAVEAINVAPESTENPANKTTADERVGYREFATLIIPGLEIIDLRLEGTPAACFGYVAALDAEAEERFSRLNQQIPFQRERLLMKGREVEIERETCDFGEDYDYNPRARRALPYEDGSEVVIVADMIAQAMGLPRPPQCACNRYPTAGSHIGTHRDKKHPFWIVSASYGALRRFGYGVGPYRDEPDPRLPILRPAPGSLIIIPGAVNEIYKHCVPTEKSVTGARISLTYRWFSK